MDTTATLREALSEAKKVIQKQNEILEQLTAAPTMQGYVVSISKKGSYRKVLTSSPKGLLEVEFPRDSFAKDLGVGSLVRLTTEPPAILDLLDPDALTGNIAVAVKEGSNGECMVDWQGATRILRYGFSKVPEAGDRMMVDDGCNIALRNIGPDESKFGFHGETGVSWADIGGLTEAKEALQEAIELPYKHPELYKAYGKKVTKGVMLYGPPGCGKTLLAKAVATALAKTHGAQAKSTGFIYVKGPELLDKYVGQTEAQIRSLFARARKHFQKNGYPAVLFIDEADALLSTRGSREGMGIETTVVPQFLSEMDGLDVSGAIVLLATNRPDTLDSAVTRDGRIDRKVRVTRPDQKGAEEIFELYLKSRPIDKSLTTQFLAQKSAELLFDPSFKIYDLLFKSEKVATPFTLGNLVNGAMISGMVDKASTFALRREIKSGTKMKGLQVEDLVAAAKMLLTENFHVNHDVEIQEHCELVGKSVDKIFKHTLNV